jgi:hypothetical protein
VFKNLAFEQKKSLTGFNKDTFRLLMRKKTLVDDLFKYLKIGLPFIQTFQNQSQAFLGIRSLNGIVKITRK